jgi:molybdate transport system permease protein
MNWEPIILTFQLALIVTVILLVISIPLANWLASTRSRSKAFIEALVSMPLVLPPTVLGFYLLVAFGQNSPIGQFLDQVFGLQLIFSFEGLIVASVIYSLPFMVQPIQSGLSHLPQNLREAAYLMGKSRWETLRKVELPNIKHALLTGIILTFAHTIGEFGVVMMIGGNIPGETKVASIAIYDEVESLNYGAANQYAFFLILITFAILLTVYLINGRSFKPFKG